MLDISYAIIISFIFHSAIYYFVCFVIGNNITLVCPFYVN